MTTEGTPRRGRQPMNPTEAAERFWSKVVMGEGCWEWQGARTPFGYGTYRIGGRTQGTHRIAWQLAHGPIEAGLVVRHGCDNPRCVRPDHLSLGTLGDNARDTVARDRWRKGSSWVMLRHAARLLGVHQDTLRRQIHLGRLHGRRFNGSPWHVQLAEVERYRAESRRVK